MIVQKKFNLVVLSWPDMADEMIHELNEIPICHPTGFVS